MDVLIGEIAALAYRISSGSKLKIFVDYSGEKKEVHVRETNKKIIDYYINLNWPNCEKHLIAVRGQLRHLDSKIK